MTILAAAAVLRVVAAPSPVDSARPARTIAPTVAMGTSLWTQFCASCHSVPAAQAQALGPLLISREYLAFATEERLDSLITYGVPGTTMLGWGNETTGVLDETQVRSLVLFLRAQNATAPSDPGWKQGRKVPLR